MPVISKATLKFLKELKANNNRDWFMANKPRYETVKSEFELFIEPLLKQISKFDPSVSGLTPKDCIFRIYRDVRFSKDKSPYKTHIGAYISGSGKKTEVHEKAGYYIHIEPGASMLAGGAYVPGTGWLKAIRQEIDYNQKEFLSLIRSKNFKTLFGELDGEKLSKVPKGYDATHPLIDLLKYKSFLAVHYSPDKTVVSDAFLSHAANVFKNISPLNGFLNRCLD
ncbi:MAG TPA: DUF2461 domain-containing protein [Bacteroidia bacterium]|nr:DUF2461 domain-containing protein [Bacteroidia bacterium]